MKKWDEVFKKNRDERVRSDNSERLLTALVNIPIAIMELIRFVIKNLPWIVLTLVACAVVLIIAVPAVQEIFIQVLTSTLKK